MAEGRRPSCSSCGHTAPPSPPRRQDDPRAGPVITALSVAIVLLLVGMLFVAMVGVNAVLSDAKPDKLYDRADAGQGGGPKDPLLGMSDDPEGNGTKEGNVGVDEGDVTLTDTTTVAPHRPAGVYTGSTYTPTTAPSSAVPLGSLARVATLHLDASRLAHLETSLDPAATLRSYAEVTWEYKHTGRQLPTDSVIVRYTDDQGNVVTRTAEDLTGTETLRPGDTMLVEGAGLLGEIVVAAGGTPLASRSTVAHPWLTADDAPLPLRLQGTSLATWDTDASVGLAVGFSNLDASAVHGPMVDTFDVEYQIGYDGEVRLTGTPENPGMRLAMDADIAASAVLAAATDGLVFNNVTQAWESFSAEAEASLEGRFRGTLAAVFSESGDLQEHGTGGAAFANGTLSGSMTVAGETDSFLDDDLPDPLLDVQETLQMQAWDGSPADEQLVLALQDLWDLDMAPGDRYAATVSTEGVALSATIQVEDGEARSVGGRLVPTLRVTSTLTFSGDDLPDIGFDRLRATHWVHAERYLPVFSETQHSKTLRAEDLQQLLDGSNMDITVPVDIQITVSADSTMALTSLQGDIGMPAVLGLRSPSEGFLYQAVAGSALRVAALGVPV